MDRLDELAERGHSLANMDTGEPLAAVRDRVESANVYLGAWPVVEALRAGADVVVTGRVTDTGLTLAPMIHEFGWAPDDWDRIAAGTVAGHINECGAQCTGGNCLVGWESLPDMADPGYPVVEARADGTFVVTKHDGTGGRVTVASVTEQLLYEMGDPHTYITPDGIVDFTTIRLEQEGRDRVLVTGVGTYWGARVAARLATDPAIILADEPTGNLDSRSANNVLNIFEGLAAQGKTILIVTHDPSITRRTNQTIILSDGEIIDQTVARALPFLSHPEMLAATKQATKQKFAPGDMILRQGESVEHFSMIISGAVDIVVNVEQTNEMSLACLGAGQFFGEVELTQGGNSIASVRAARRGAEVALLPKSIFYELIDGSPLTRSAIRDVAETRLAEHNRRKTDR